MAGNCSETDSGGKLPEWFDPERSETPEFTPPRDAPPVTWSNRVARDSYASRKNRAVRAFRRLLHRKICTRER